MNKRMENWNSESFCYRFGNTRQVFHTGSGGYRASWRLLPGGSFQPST